MRVSIHQPHYLPWLRYFHKIALSDVFVVLDDAQFNRNGYQNRNSIKSAQGALLLTVPVLQSYQQNLQDVRCNNSLPWPRKHWRAIEQNYRKAPFFDRYRLGLSSFYDQRWESLNLLNGAMLAWFLEQLGLKTRLVYSHDLGVNEASTARLLTICRMLGATQYLSGAHAVDTYVDLDAFERAGVELVAQQWTSPVYEQLHTSVGYVPDLSVVDLLMMKGPESLQSLLLGGAVQQLGVPHG